MRTAFITNNFDRIFSEQIMPTDIPVMEADDLEPFEEASYYVNMLLSKDEEKICDMATD